MDILSHDPVSLSVEMGMECVLPNVSGSLRNVSDPPKSVSKLPPDVLITVNVD